MSFPMFVSAMDPIQALSQMRLGVYNALEYASVVASSSATGFDPYAVIDGRPSTYWKPAAGAATHTLTFTLPFAQYVDSFGVYSSDLAANASSVQLQYSNDGVTWTNCADPMAPAGTAPMYITFTKVFAAYFRVIVYADGTTPAIAVLYAGQEFRPELGMCVGFAPPSTGGRPIVLTNNSMAGSWLGRSLRSRIPYQGQLSFDYIPPERARTVWAPLMARLARKPFFLKWHGSAFPYEIAYCWADNADMIASYKAPNFLSASVQFTGLVG